MAFKELLAKQLKGKKITSKDLPTGYQRIGDIIILSLNPKLKKQKAIGKAIPEIFPQIKTVCAKTGSVTGQFREPKLQIIAGSSTETEHKENNCLYKLDVKKIMFAKGNLKERARIAAQVKKDETVIDLFAGIGYFTLPIAKLAKPKAVYAFELNPKSLKYLLENIHLNKVQDKVIAILGNCAREAPKLGKIADRVIMGLLPSAERYLKVIKKIVKPGAIVHYHAVGKNPKELVTDIKKIFGQAKILKKVKVKSFAPRRWHFVIDFQVK